MSLISLCVLLSALFPAAAFGHGLVVDVDSLTPGIQSSISVSTGDVFDIDIYWVGTGLPLDAYGFAVEWNDVAGVITPTAPTLFDPSGTGMFAEMDTPTDLISTAPLAPGNPLFPYIPPFGPVGVGSSGSYTATDGGVGAFAGVPGGVGLPGPGAQILLESLSFTATSIGTTDISPTTGLIAPGAPGLPAFLFVVGAGGSHFYDQASGNAFSADYITPGTVSVVPLPGSIFLMGPALFGMAGIRRLKKKRKSH